MNTFEEFENGRLFVNDTEIDFSELPLNAHPTFKGVSLKHLVTAKETNGKFSYHLVRIAPNCCIGNHIHDTQLETHEVILGKGVCVCGEKTIHYTPGTAAVMPKGVLHNVTADESGLYIFAKFMPALN